MFDSHDIFHKSTSEQVIFYKKLVRIAKEEGLQAAYSRTKNGHAIVVRYGKHMLEVVSLVGEQSVCAQIGEWSLSGEPGSIRVREDFHPEIKDGLNGYEFVWSNGDTTRQLAQTIFDLFGKYFSEIGVK